MLASDFNRGALLDGRLLSCQSVPPWRALCYVRSLDGMQSLTVPEPSINTRLIRRATSEKFPTPCGSVNWLRFGWFGGGAQLGSLVLINLFKLDYWNLIKVKYMFQIEQTDAQKFAYPILGPGWTKIHTPLWQRIRHPEATINSLIRHWKYKSTNLLFCKEFSIILKSLGRVEFIIRSLGGSNQ